MLVHAHPDDESIGTGATMARYVAEGAQVTLVTCTMGEEGEVLVPELVHVGAENEDRLAEYRIVELTNAMEALGVTDFVRLGGDGRYRDSGMDYDDARRAIPRVTSRDDCFWKTDILAPTNDLVALIRDRRPQVLITYDEIGAYGHPDHIQAHRVATYAAALAGVPSYRADLGEAWTVSRLLWTAMSESRMRQGIRVLRETGDFETWKGSDPDGEMPPMARPDADIVAEIDGHDQVGQKMAALRAYPTQIAMDGPFFAMSEKLGDEAWSHEYYRLAGGVPFPAAEGWADDLFAGLD